jgi:hypothetical protein
MNSSKVGLIDQTNEGAVSPTTLQQYAAALQQQVDNHLAPAWNVRADISVLAAGAGVPPDTLPLNIVDALTGQAGVHTDYRGQLSAEAVNDDQLSITLSHELLEMLVDPLGTRVIQAPDIDRYSGGQQVQYLVEVCDPCAIYTYDIDGVPVSDFVLPSFYDPDTTGAVDYAGFLDRPLTVPLGCYISWLDPTDNRWHELQPNGTFLVGAQPGLSRDDRDAAFGDANPDRHDVPAIHRAWPQAVRRRRRPRWPVAVSLSCLDCGDGKGQRELPVEEHQAMLTELFEQLVDCFRWQVQV